MLLQVLRANRVTLFLTNMRFPIQFEDELALVAGQVPEEGADGVLTAKLEAGEPTISQALPQNTLGRRQLSSELACPLASAWVA
jgi:hypothetical protein